MKLDIVTHVSLDFLGEKWKDCFIDFSYITADELKDFAKAQSKMQTDQEKTVEEASERSYILLENKFISGKVLSGGQVVEVKKEDIRSFPMSIIAKSIGSLMNVDDIVKKKD